MNRGPIFRRHARLFSFFAVLLLAGGLVTLLFQEARAVGVNFVAPPSTVGGSAVFTVDVVIPQGQRVPIKDIQAIIERPTIGSEKFRSEVVTRAGCQMTPTPGFACPDSAPLSQSGSLSGGISKISFVNSYERQVGAGYTIGYQVIFQDGAYSGTRTGYGYDNVSPAFSANGYGYGYGFATGATGSFSGSGYAYGYSNADLFLRFEVTVSGSSLGSGTFFLTVLVNTGSSTIGDLSSPFTTFAVTGAGGNIGTGGSTGAAAPTVTTSAGVTTATTTVTGTAGSSVAVNLGTVTTGTGVSLGTLTLNLGQTVTGAQVTVKASTAPFPGASAISTGFGSILYIDITAPAGATGGTLTFTLNAAQLGTATPAQVSMLDLTVNPPAMVPTTCSGSGGGASCSSTFSHFSPFAIAFDQAPPTISDLRPPDGSGATTRPLIAAKLSDNRGINTAATKMFVDGQPVTATVTASEILYTPPVALTQGVHTVRVDVVDLSGHTATRTWTFNAAAAADETPPTVVPQTPAKSGFTNNPRPSIHATWNDNLGIDTTKATMTIDGAPAVGPEVTAAGITYTPAVGLTDGKHTVTVTVGDTSGNSGFATWEFTVDTALPLVGVVEPADGSTVASARPMLRASYSDALSGIDTARVRLLVDGQPVQASAADGSVSYTPGSDLRIGTHTATVQVVDKAGNTAEKTWTFTVGPQGAPFPWALVSIVVIILVIAIAGGVYYMRRGQGGQGGA